MQTKDFTSYMQKIRSKAFPAEELLLGQNNILAAQEDILAMQYLAPLSKTYLPWSTFSMRPSGVVKVINEIVINKKSNVIECGSGISTFYIASILREKGGHLFTIEHDEQWAMVFKRFLEEQQLIDFVSLITVPLTESSLAINGSFWYDEIVLTNAINNQHFDLLLVDGPPAFGPGRIHARYPAVPYFSKFLSADYTIILDDINRGGEKEVISKWEDYLNIRFDKHLVDGSVAIGRAKTKNYIV